MPFKVGEMPFFGDLVSINYHGSLCNNTMMMNSELEASVFLHGNPIIVYNKGTREVTLNGWGYLTTTDYGAARSNGSTTRRRMNVLGFRVKVKKGECLIETKTHGWVKFNKELTYPLQEVYYGA